MSEKPIVLVTGGNTGIGYETVKALYASSNAHTILMGSRSLDKAAAAISEIRAEIPSSKSTMEAIQIDIEDDASIDACFSTVSSKYGKVDALVNNAGGSFDFVLQSKPGAAGIREAWDHTYSLNVTSTEVFTQTFMSLLIASSSPRLLFVTSGLSSLTTCSDGLTSAFARAPVARGWPKPPVPSVTAYRASKTALNMLMLEYHRILQPDGVRVFCISPGFLATGLGGMGAERLRELGAGEPRLGGEFIRDVVEGKRDEDSGKVVHRDGLQPW